jgi:hypothetical protein
MKCGASARRLHAWWIVLFDVSDRVKLLILSDHQWQDPDRRLFGSHPGHTAGSRLADLYVPRLTPFSDARQNRYAIRISKVAHCQRFEVLRRDRVRPDRRRHTAGATFRVDWRSNTPVSQKVLDRFFYVFGRGSRLPRHCVSQASRRRAGPPVDAEMVGATVRGTIVCVVAR